jgi:7-cyano-7-deazaguanine reductase
MNKDEAGMPLGSATTSYNHTYDSGLLYPIERNRLPGSVRFNGFDVWNCYEMSWLNAMGKPEVRIMRFIVPCNSANIVESKSVKLYLNSFSNTSFDNENIVLQTIKEDIGKQAGENIEVELFKLDQFNGTKLTTFNGKLLDELEVKADKLDVTPKLLKLASDDEIVSEVLYSNLLRSNCPVTNQPDWASIQISYTGRKIDHESLLLYIISFRNHNEFHEQCVERIFADIMNLASPSELTVQAKYTRRGGIDINPIRSTVDLIITDINLLRDVRQ